MYRYALFFLLLAAGCDKSVDGEAETYDVLIKGGLVYDGSPDAAGHVNIGISDDRIVTMDASATATAKVTIDAHGKIVAPGFVDPHTHATAYLREPDTAANLNYLLQGVTTVFIGNDGYGVSGGKQTLALLETQGFGPNVAFLAGHGQIRKAVMGMADRTATEAELQAMQDQLREAMQQGAFGLSTGLFYAPGSYAGTDEVIALAKTAASMGGVYDTHMRSESSHGDGVLVALEETLLVAEQADIPVHISHIKALGKDVWKQTTTIVERINTARANGLKVSANQYPWSASGTRFSNALIPRWVMADSRERMRERLDDAELRPGILDDMRASLERRGGPDAMLVTHADSRFVGMTLSEIATQLELEPVLAAIEAVLDGDPSIASFVMQQEGIEQIAVQPWVMTGSDGSSGHPRLYGTYPKAWQDFVVNGALMTAEQYIRRGSGLVADTFGVCDRGYLRKGYFADIVVFDADHFRPQATYKQPTELSTGVTALLINGELVIDNGHTALLPGRIIRKTECK